MKKAVTALTAFLAAAPAYAGSDDGVDYCVHRKLREQLTMQGVDVKDVFNAVFLPAQVKPFVVDCQDARGGNKSPRFTESRREYTHVIVKVYGDNRTGMMHVVPKYKYQRP